MSHPAFRPFLVVSATLVALLCVQGDAHAELGGVQPASSASASKTLLNGALRMRTLTDAGNTTLNEYATNTGEIVAYAWEGPTMPDLRELLGRYADSYQTGVAAASADGNLHASRVARPDVIVESGGPMRGYIGRAWLPAALPPGVSPADFQ